jgi:hypothetical protein
MILHLAPANAGNQHLAMLAGQARPRLRMCVFNPAGTSIRYRTRAGTSICVSAAQLFDKVSKNCTPDQ